LNRLYHIFIFIICFFTSCESSDTNTSDSLHIKYFGFALVNTLWDDPTDTTMLTNYSGEVAAFSNIADILVVEPNENITSKLNDILFFEPNGTNAPSGTSYGLRLDYQQRWNTFIETNTLSENTSLIQAFYIGEEPTWNGISFEDLKAATDYIKSTIPDVATLVIEAYPALDDLQIPISVDWVGFDHYFIKDPKNDAQFLSQLNLLKSKLSSDDQKLVLVMDTHYIETLHGNFGNITLEEMTSVATSYYDLALSERKTIALIGYFWPSGFDDPNAIGARHMPEETKEEYRRIGLEITQK